MSKEHGTKASQRRYLRSLGNVGMSVTRARSVADSAAAVPNEHAARQSVRLPRI